jgi:UDP-N-acetylmuramate dehydrogenase
MPVRKETIERLGNLPNLAISQGTLLSRYTRFGIGGPAEVYAETADEQSFMQAFAVAQSSGADYTVIGDGTNLIVSDAGFPGIVLRFMARHIHSHNTTVRAHAGAELQALVDYCIDWGLKGIETMTGIPGSVGAAVYGNAGAYGHSIEERIQHVRFFDGGEVRVLGKAECEFHYRESVFKRHKDWIIFSAELGMDAAPAEELRKAAAEIFQIRLAKYPPTMKCAGSIFKNLILAELPEPVRRQIPDRVIREGKAPSAYFLEEVGAKGMRSGDIHVADYHANLIYNAGQGTARQLCEIISELKSRVRDRFGLELEEEVQYVGFQKNGSSGSI